MRRGGARPSNSTRATPVSHLEVPSFHSVGVLEESSQETASQDLETASQDLEAKNELANAQARIAKQKKRPSQMRRETMLKRRTLTSREW